MKKPTKRPAKPRRRWFFNPATRVKESARRYSRRQSRVLERRGWEGS
jgi:hypothetical protein